MFIDRFFLISSAAHETIMGFLILLSIVSLTIMMDRFFFLHRMQAQCLLILSEMTTALDSNDKDRMKLIYEKHALTPAGQILQKSWDYMNKKGIPGLEEMITALILTIQPNMGLARLNFLATIGSNAPFIGLLGTIFGVMESFQSLGTENQSIHVVMIGIAKALVATSVGLIVAIPAIVAYNYLQKKLQTIFNYMESMKEIMLSFAKSSNK